MFPGMKIAVVLCGLFAVSCTGGSTTPDGQSDPGPAPHVDKNSVQSGVGACDGPGGECCNVCKNGGSITNPDHEFVMTDTLSGEQYEWTCGWLEEVLADVNVGSTAAAGEARYCGVAQIWAERECSCSGDPLPDDDVYDPNPACDLCGLVDGDHVPSLLENELVETGVAGRMPCGGLYYALAEGVLSEQLCPIVQSNAGAACCTVPSLDPGSDASDGSDSDADGDSTDNEPEPMCLGLGQECEDSGPECCAGFECRTRQLGMPKICSAARATGRQRISRNGRGGAAGNGRR